MVREGRKMVFARPFSVLRSNRRIQETPLPQAHLVVCQTKTLFCFIYYLLGSVCMKPSRPIVRSGGPTRRGVRQSATT
jgi:hypothetical protein